MSTSIADRKAYLRDQELAFAAMVERARHPVVSTAAPPVTRKEVQSMGDKISAMDKAEAKRQRKADKRKPK